MFNAFVSYSHTSDNHFAPALQEGLQKFAKPWFKKRNLEIFRDESSLSASPHLWDNITKALDQSEYLILLASPASEKSKWVNKEIEYWLEHKSIDNLLIALTEGNMEWDDENKCFLNPDINSLPPALDTAFDAEPFYIDLRFSRTEQDLSLTNPIFKKEVLKLAAKLHNKNPNDLASEEVTVHRKWLLVRNTTMFFLVLLLIASITLAIFANSKRIEADNKTILAEKNAKEAKDNLVEFKLEEFRRNLKNGNTYLEAEEYSLANESFVQAITTAKDKAFNRDIPKVQVAYLDSVLTICKDKTIYK